MFGLPLNVHWTSPAALTRYAAHVLRNDVRNDPPPVSWIELMWYASHAIPGTGAGWDCDWASGTCASASQVLMSLPVFRSYSWTAESDSVPLAGPPKLVRSME